MVMGQHDFRKHRLLFWLPAICSLYLCTASAQQNKVDSLNTLIRNAKHDTARARGYAALTEVFAISNPDTVEGIADKAIAIADKNLETANKEERYSYLYTKAGAISNKGYVYMQRGDAKKAEELFTEALAIEKENNNLEGVASASNNLATVYFRNGKTEEALIYFQQALKTQQTIGAREGEATSLNNIGAVYDNRGQVESALDYYHRSLKIQESLDNKPKIGTCLNNIAAIYTNLGLTDKAIEYNNRSMKVREVAGDKRGMAQSLNNIGAIYFKRGNLTEALRYYERSLALYKSVANKPGIAYSLNNTGFVYYTQGQTEKALTNFRESLAIYDTIKEKRGISNSLYYISLALVQQNKAKEALPYAQRALQAAQEGGYAEATRNAYYALARADSATGNAVSALVNYKEYIRFRDSIANEATRKAAVKKQLQYSYEKKEDKLKADVARQQVELRQEQLITAVITGGVVVVLLFALILLNRFRLRQKHRMEQQLSRQQKAYAGAVMETQEQERKRIAEDLHDSLGHLLSTVKMNLQTLPDSRLVEHPLQLLNQASHEIRNITFDLMPRTLEEEGLAAALHELADKTNRSGALRVQLQIHGVDVVRMERQVEFNVYRIIQEAVNNILKHAGATEVTIQLIRHDDQFTIMIEDDGSGFDAETAGRTGRGLRNITSRSAWLNGTADFDTGPGRGTTLTVSIPLMQHV